MILKHIFYHLTKQSITIFSSIWQHLIRRALGVMEYNGEGKPTAEEVISVLSEVIDSVETRPDLQFIAFRRLLMISLEAIYVFGKIFMRYHHSWCARISTRVSYFRHILVSVFYCPSIVNNALLQKFNQLWSYRKVCKLHLTFEMILSPRNIDLLLTLTDSEAYNIRRALTTFLVYVINNNLLHVSRLYSQLLRLLRRDWHPVSSFKNVLYWWEFSPINKTILFVASNVFFGLQKVLNNVAECLKQVLGECNGGHEKINYIISWIAHYIEEDDFDWPLI